MWKLTVFLCCVWALSLLYGEMVAFWLPSMWTCSWPQLRRASSSQMMGEEAYLDDFVKVAVITDPQLMDKTSLGLAPKSLALEIAQFYTDLYMRRSYFASILPFKPDVILFLGDYFDGGPVLSDEEWQESLSRFRHIFKLNHQRKTSDTPVYFLSGNHDVGYASLYSRSPEVMRRYESEFGARNYHFTVGEIEFIAVDAQTLDGPLHRNFTFTSWNFVKNISTDARLNPKVLLTHIPLYRPDWTSCGPHRSSPIINQRVSHAAYDKEIIYQNYLSEETSNHLLDLVKPVLVLSGHDHDQCTVTHLRKFGPVTEHTVGTVSWQQGNLYPSFMLLSVSKLSFSNRTDLEDAVSTQLCFLPMQTHIYIWYLSLFVITILVLLLRPANGFGYWNHFSRFVGTIRRAISENIFRGGQKEKDEDEICEYETIWDAEGSMHLIKKASNVSFTGSSDTQLVGRGNAVVRSVMKKQISRDTNASFAVEMNADVRLDGTGKFPQRSTSKFRTMVIRRLFRTFQMLTVIAALNVPLYMMLLFKDWIDHSY
ncbi:hypothetical protein NE237_028788 [Protea cynaroides]|uniref:Calcineurin-like phosphoesterase domain-containing protein n=1 Tax=Protea cynaroides TaxID=273540 RepID=A0A9Q0GRV2_9MAGN|nr:hypothetical protein NE237_028788 [Protea cynaroides]